jgi:hypothetical protein
MDCKITANSLNHKTLRQKSGISPIIFSLQTAFGGIKHTHVEARFPLLLTLFPARHELVAILSTKGHDTAPPRIAKKSATDPSAANSARTRGNVSSKISHPKPACRQSAL